MPIYDTVFFITKLLEQHFAQRNELTTLRNSLGATDHTTTDLTTTDTNKDWDIHNTDLLSLKTQHQPIVDWFKTKTIIATINESTVDTTGFFDEAAVVIGSDHELLGEVCERIRHTQQKGFNSTLIYLDKKTSEDAKSLVSFIKKLHEYSLVARYFVNKEDKTIRLVLQNAPNVRRFFAGEWLEWYVLMTGLRICQERKTVFSCARNLFLAFPPNEKRELDVFFLINKTKPLYIECKSGDFRQDLNKYVVLRKRLGIEQKFFILCVADIDPELAEGLSAMHGLTFVNTQTLGPHLSMLI
jgi:hypothetical protein